MKKFIFYMILIAWFSAAANAQDLTQCKEKLKKAFVGMNEFYSDTSGILNVHYQINTVAFDKSTSLEDINMYTGNHVFVVTSSLSSYYSDQNNAYLVMPKEKIIYQVDLQQIDMAKSQQMAQFNITLLDSAVVSSCKTLENGYQRIVLEYKGRILAGSSIQYVDYILDVEKEQIKEIVVHYQSSFKLISASYTFIEIKKAAALPFSGSVKSVFFNKNNTLISAYAGYKYYDLRQQ